MIFQKYCCHVVEKINNKVDGQLLLKLLTNFKIIISETFFKRTLGLEKWRHP
jgi:hypothetical protein